MVYADREEMKRDSVQIDYPGAEISVNHYLGRRKDGGYYIKPETVVFKTELQWLLKHCHLEDYTLPLEVSCSGWFKNERSAPDLSNLSKIINDSIEELTGINDKFIHWHDGKRIIGEKHPYLIITISESPQVASSVPTKLKSDRVKGGGGIILLKSKKRGLESHEKN